MPRVEAARRIVTHQLTARRRLDRTARPKDFLEDPYNDLFVLLRYRAPYGGGVTRIPEEETGPLPSQPE